MAYKTINPYTNELIKEFPNATDTQIEEALTTTHSLYRTWKKENVADRAQKLHDVAQTFRDNSEELAKVLVTEMGKLINEARGEVELCAMIADYFADNSAAMLSPVPLKTTAGNAHIEKESVGVLMMVEPWNFPYYQIMRVYAPNYMVGNPMILKHSSNTPWAGAIFQEMIEKAGAPKGSLINLFLTHDQVDKVIADSRIQGVALTGSERGGSSVAQTAGKYLKKSSMELGGNDAFIVLEDANIDEVISVANRARTYNAGQVCTSSKRFIVADKLYDEFLERLADNYKQFVPGDPMDEKTTLAPLSSAKAKQTLQKQLDDALAAGAKLYFGNTPIDLPGQFFQPSIITDITPDNPAYYEEMFGPVAQVYRASSEQEAIDIANDSHYGLGGIVFAGDSKHGEEVAQQIDTGMVFVNTFLYTLPEIPFGGVKRSGYGREMSSLGLNAFVNDKLIVSVEKPDLDNLGGALF
ncbi:NAD-dependent succinate-semialdehyde dehydrogenase [Liquorilactobacillus mali]|uniref:Succinate-semialdehyde dehydrogenase (NAD(P)+) n=2 Tax=Liquorilactobacillus mali TaxID=1618 RepID=A0A0R2E4A2_9LACO|nr:NAD-dependent succinate-semialdehyde dehydrogenase [Liquorilactobacillus mali]KRN11266.1 succinate-semialdehyde dehydrogenase (NAD(P)+) [Liquorilactobacillus mali KCTC 3596 = DSM 20444]QFQ73747.1 NAD-dependent succinate-semialdehyde dehydrogenase [Liquorilactobacillus mali]